MSHGLQKGIENASKDNVEKLKLRQSHKRD